MKCLRLLLIFSFFLATLNDLQATHSQGGEIGWKCLNNGKYVFYMTFYRDCAGIQYTYQDETLDIVGSPLPTDGAGNTISTILMKADTLLWKDKNEGETAPSCTAQYGSEYSCSDADDGVLQAFYYTSDTITLDGVPPSAGWRFIWVAVCCRSEDLLNVNSSGGQLLLRAIMFPTRKRDNVNPCIFSSPEFVGPPFSLACRGQEFAYNHAAISPEGDSLTFGWDQAYNPPIASPVAVSYKNGYDFNNPTPDDSLDSRNTPSTLIRTSGQVRLGVYGGSGVEKFLNVIRVDAWRDGQIIARVYREIPLTIVDCPTFPSGFINKNPEILIDGEVKKSTYIDIDAVAGTEIRASIEIRDLDQTGVGLQLQTLRLQPFGSNFSDNFQENGNCNNPPCAYLRKSDPKYDAADDIYYIDGLAGLNTEFVWKTSCENLNGKIGGLYRFYFKINDDHCPLPGTEYRTLTVRLRAAPILEEPIVKGVSIGLDGKGTYQWVPPIDSAFSFRRYLVERATVNDGFTPTIFNDLNRSLREYHSRKTYEQNFGVYRFLNNNPTLGPDLLKKVKNGPLDLDWYLRMTTVSGCDDTAKSIASEKVQVIELESNPGGFFPEPERSGVNLSWNRPKPINAKTHPYFLYESPTHFYIWENDSMDKNGVIDRMALADENNWYLRGKTTASNYNRLTSNVCGQYVAFRVEARDSVKIYPQGYGLSSHPDSIETLTFSTFSMIDTFYMINRGIIPRPQFDTLEVLRNGDVYISINPGNAGTIAEFEVYENTTIGTRIDSLTKSNSSAIISNARASDSIRNYIMKGIDECNPSVSRIGGLYNTILPSGKLESRCPPLYRLSWNKPGGFPNGVKSYKVYSTLWGREMKLRATLNHEDSTAFNVPLVGRGVNYEYQVVAIDDQNSVNISAIHSYTSPTDLRTEELVPAPPLQCAEVESNGSVTIYYIPPNKDIALDSTANLLAVEFSYRPVGMGTWTLFNGVDTSKYSLNIGGINAHQSAFEFKARSRSGCDGNYWSDYNYISTNGKFVYVVNDTLKTDLKNVNYLWFDCNKQATIPEERNYYFIPKDTGDYALIIDQVFPISCIDTSECIPVMSVGIQETPFVEQFNFYPNPTNGKVIIISDRLQKSMRLQIRNMHGQLLQQANFSNQKQMELEIEGKSGIYFISLFNEKGERANIKVIKR